MHTECKEGVGLCLLFEKHLREWGWFDAYLKAIELMPVGLPVTREFQNQAKLAESALFSIRYTYASHIANCLICSRGLVSRDSIAKLKEKLEESAPCELEEGKRTEE